MVFSRNNQNDLESLRQWPTFSIRAESIPGCMFGPAWSTIIYRFLCGFICVSLCQSIKIKPTNMYIASARAQFKINTHRSWNWHHVHSRQVVSCPVQPRARHWSCVFWRDFSGVKRTHWTTGSWRSCLSLEVVSSIPAWSTIIYRFLCGFICVSLCQSIKIKPTNIM